MTAPSRRLAALFLAALVGVLAAVGLVVADVLGGAAAAAYAALAVVALGVAAARARRTTAAPAPVQRCACCDGDHTAPVQVV